MELDHFVIGSSLDPYASPFRENEQNVSPAAPPAAVPDSPFDAFTADVLDFEVSANLILPNTCFKPIAADGQPFDLCNEEEDGVLFLDLEDWDSLRRSKHLVPVRPGSGSDGCPARLQCLVHFALQVSR